MCGCPRAPTRGLTLVATWFASTVQHHTQLFPHPWLKSISCATAATTQASQGQHRHAHTHTWLPPRHQPEATPWLPHGLWTQFQQTSLPCTQCPKAVGSWVGEAPATMLQHAKLELDVVAKHVATAPVVTIVTARHCCPKAVSSWVGETPAATHWHCTSDG